ncbi:MAG: hypothetical protein AUH28_05920 [Acidobacteria bacterium 13_1_40CM_56_16]|nr:MAG: hypothetical protein AUH28_05920 [Acidobacteria bacterium 13_1_40CM_56_16]
MAQEKWNEEGRIWEPDHGLLNEEQIAQCARADETETFQSPVPTQMVSNGEYMPVPQTKSQKRMEERIKELAESASKKLGISRRRFLAGSGGMAASFLAMNEVFGRFFNVDPIEMFEPEAYAQSGTPRDLFIFDDQLHLVRGTMDGPVGLRGLAQGPTSGGTSNEYNPKGLPDEHGKVWAPWNPALVGLPNTRTNYQIVQFIKDVYLDSQINIGLLSNVTGSVLNVLGGSEPVPTNVRDARRGEMLTADQTVAARNFINEISGSTRMLAHGLLYVGKGNLDYIQEQTERNAPDSWKGYNISESAKVDNNPNSPLRQWRHDDENVAYPTFELIQKYYAKLKDTAGGPGTWSSRRSAQSGEGLAEPELHHLSRVHPSPCVSL